MRGHVWYSGLIRTNILLQPLNLAVQFARKLVKKLFHPDFVSQRMCEIQFWKKILSDITKGI